MQKVESSTIHSIGYDAVDQSLQVLFNHGACAGRGCEKCGNSGHSGQMYTYSEVPVEKYVAVRDAESVGRAFGDEINNWKNPDTKEGFKFTKRSA